MQLQAGIDFGFNSKPKFQVFAPTTLPILPSLHSQTCLLYQTEAEYRIFKMSSYHEVNMKFFSISKVVHHRLKSMSFWTNLQITSILDLLHKTIIVRLHDDVFHYHADSLFSHNATRIFAQLISLLQFSPKSLFSHSLTNWAFKTFSQHDKWHKWNAL